VHVVVQALSESADSPSFGLMQGWSTVFPMGGFFALWFGFAGPALAARHPGWRNQSTTEQPVRTVSLEPRDRGPILPTGAWVFAWACYAACVAATVWAVITTSNPLSVLGLLFFPGFAWGAHMARSEPEPRDADDSPDLAEAYAALGRFKAWGFLVGGLAGSIVFSATAILMVKAPGSAGLIGGLGGALVGLGGGVFGTLASVRRAAIQRLIAERSEGLDGAPVNENGMC